MTNDIPIVRYDTKHHVRHLFAFYVGLAPICVAILYTVFAVQSFAGFLVVMVAGFLLTVAFTMRIMSYPICPTCDRTIRQRPLNTHAETDGPTYYCFDCNTRWIVDMNWSDKQMAMACLPCKATNARSIQDGG